jgi:CheY-like chemotaxis protein
VNHKKILLIDDDADDQLIFMDAISEITTGIECITANNGSEALDHLKTITPAPSIIFLDLNMPRVNGFECLEQIKKDERLKQIPVIIFTTSNSPVDRRRIKDSGAEVFLTKTSDFNSLKASLQEILETDFSQPGNK